MKKSILRSLQTIAIACIVLSITGCSAGPKTIKLNQLDVETIAGVSISIHDYVGKPLVVNLWATWCPPCIKELPTFNKLAKQLGDKVTFILISDETPEKLTSFMESHAELQHFTFLRSKKNIFEEHVRSIPATYFFNASGELVEKAEGEMSEQELSTALKAISVDI